MSDFLLNLARRGAGLAPVVHSRLAPPSPPLAAEGSLTEIAEERTLPTPTMKAAVAESEPAPRARTALSPEPPRPPVAPPAVAPEPLIQRAPLEISRVMPPLAPVAVPVTPVVPSAPILAPVALPPELPTVSAPPLAAPPAPVAAAVIPEHAERVEVEAREEARPLATVPPAVADSMVRVITEVRQADPPPQTALSRPMRVVDSPRPRAASETPREESQIAVVTGAVASAATGGEPAVLPAPIVDAQVHEGFERPLERLGPPEDAPRETALPQPTAERPVAVEPLPAARRVEFVMLPSPPPAPALATDPPQPERVVHVSIGAIEIRAADGAIAPPAPPPLASAPAPRTAQPAAGFAEFARLRSYGPWQW